MMRQTVGGAFDVLTTRFQEAIGKANEASGANQEFVRAIDDLTTVITDPSFVEGLTAVGTGMAYIATEIAQVVEIVGRLQDLINNFSWGKLYEIGNWIVERDPFLSGANAVGGMLRDSATGGSDPRGIVPSGSQGITESQLPAMVDADLQARRDLADAIAALNRELTEATDPEEIARLTRRIEQMESTLASMTPGATPASQKITQSAGKTTLKSTKGVTGATDDFLTVSDEVLNSIQPTLQAVEGFGVSTSQMIAPIVQATVALQDQDDAVQELDVSFRQFDSALSQYQQRIAVLKELQSGRPYDEVDLIRQEIALREQLGEQAEGHIQLLRQTYDEYRRLEDEISRTQNLAYDLGQSFEDAFGDAILRARDLGEVLENLLNDLLRSLYRYATSSFFDALPQMLFQGLTGILNPTAPTAAVGAPTNILPTTGTADVTTGFAGIYSRGGVVERFANGGLIGGAHTFPMAQGMGLAGEAGLEGILPLTTMNDGRLGVASAGGTEVEINIYDQRTGNKGGIEAQENRGPDGKRMIEIFITDTVKRNIERGTFDGAMRSRFGARPSLAQR
jgi:hypothetical protein